YAIVEGSAVRNEGVIAKVADMMDGKLVISIEGDMEKRLINTDKTVYKKLKPGFQISVLPPTMEVLEVLPNLEVKSLLLGEKPNVVFLDEMEALFTVRGMMDTSGVHKNIIAQILSEMDGLVELHDVFVIGATNRADLVDPALLRPGRFDEIIEIPRPDRQAAEEILRIYLNEELPVQA